MRENVAPKQMLLLFVQFDFNLQSEVREWSRSPRQCGRTEQKLKSIIKIQINLGVSCRTRELYYNEFLMRWCRTQHTWLNKMRLIFGAYETLHWPHSLRPCTHSTPRHAHMHEMYFVVRTSHIAPIITHREFRKKIIFRIRLRCSAEADMVVCAAVCVQRITATPCERWFYFDSDSSDSLKRAHARTPLIMLHVHVFPFMCCLCTATSHPKWWKDSQIANRIEIGECEAKRWFLVHHSLSNQVWKLIQFFWFINAIKLVLHIQPEYSNIHDSFSTRKVSCTQPLQTKMKSNETREAHCPSRCRWVDGSADE